MRMCSVCGKPHHAKGLCITHYRHANPSVFEACQLGRKRWKLANPERVREHNAISNAKAKKLRAERPKVSRPRRRKIRDRLKRKRLRERAFIALGGKCVRCGLDDWRVLQIDHINGDGYKLKKDNHRYQELVRSMMQGDVNKRYQLLCANCHVLKTIEHGEYKQRDAKMNGSLPLFDWIAANQPPGRGS